VNDEQHDVGTAAEDQGDVPAKVVRHRRHRFPARTRVVKARYDEQEYAALAAAAAQARLTPSGFLAGAGLSAAGRGPGPSRSGDRELLAELLSLRTALRRYAVNVNQAIAALHSTGDAPVLAGPGRRGRRPRRRQRRRSDPARRPPSALSR